MKHRKKTIFSVDVLFFDELILCAYFFSFLFFLLFAAAEKRRKAEETQQPGATANASAQRNGGPSVSFLLRYYVPCNVLSW